MQTAFFETCIKLVSGSLKTKITNKIDRKSRFLKIEDRVPAQKIEANRFRTVPGAGNRFKN